MNATRLCGLGVALVMSVVSAGPVGAATPDEVRALAAEHRYSEAMRAGRALVASKPRLAAAHAAYGAALSAVMRDAEAAAELARARKLAPGDGKLAVDHAVALAMSGGMEGARRIGAEVAERWPDRSFELTLLFELEDPETWRASNAQLPPGSAPHVAARVMDTIADGRLEELLRDDVDRAALSRLKGASGLADDRVISLAVAAIRGGVEASGSGRLVGYRVGSESRDASGGLVAVDVALAVELPIARADLEAIEKALEDGSRIPQLPDDLAAVLRSLEPADRKASLLALAAHPRHSTIPMVLELRQVSGGWKVADVTIGLAGLRASGELAKAVAGAAPVGHEASRRRQEPQRDDAIDSRNAIAQATGSAVAAILVIGLVVTLVRRRRSRRVEA